MLQSEIGRIYKKFKNYKGIYICLQNKNENQILKAHYESLFIDSIKKINTNNYEIDELIDSPDDRRFGITLLLRPSSEIKKNISAFLQKIRKIEPYQYYYRESDMHITVLSIISCYHGFSLSDINIQDYVKIINETISNFKSFTIDLKGITASPSCVMIQGFSKDDNLDNLRNIIRSLFTNSLLENSIDTRYEIKTAHSTVIRLRKELADNVEYINTLKLFKEYDFGTFEVNEIEIVYNDWYQRIENTNKLACFKLQMNDQE